MNAKTIETLLTQIFAAALTLEIDKTIFRGFLPDKVNNALGVIVEAFDNGNEPAGSVRIAFQLLGRFTDRQKAMDLSRQIDAWLPKYSTELRLTKSGSVAVYESTASGKKVYELSCNGVGIFPAVDG